MWEVIEIKNNTYRSEGFVAPEVFEGNPIDMLRNDKYISETIINDHISSFNFTREAFRKDKWNDITNKARGLYLYTSGDLSGEVAGRAYEKFFNIGEEPITEMHSLRRNLKFPITGYIKYNGYLGLVYWDKVDDHAVYSTKSVSSGEHVEYFYDIMEGFYPTEDIENWVRDNDYTLVFEVLDPEHDPHIIEYSEPGVVLLDAVKNDIEYSKLSYPELEKVASELGLPVKVVFYKIRSWEEFIDILQTKDEYSLDDAGIEGYVFEDLNGFMFKYKNTFYKTWKWFRSIKDSMAKGRNIDTGRFTKEIETKIHAFLKTLPREFLAEHNIIQLRNLYYEMENTK